MQSTIALLRYQVRALLPAKALWVLMALYLVLLTLSLMVKTLSLSGADSAFTLFFSEGIRVLISLWLLVQVAAVIQEDRQSQHLSWMLALPLSPGRWLLTHALAQWVVMLMLLSLMAAPLYFLFPLPYVAFWLLQLALELTLLLLLVSWLSLSLPNLVSSILLSGLYWLAAHWQGLIAALLQQQTDYQGAQSGILTDLGPFLLQAFSWVLPATEAFYETGFWLQPLDGIIWQEQLLAVLLYGALMLALCWFELHRKHGR